MTIFLESDDDKSNFKKTLENGTKDKTNLDNTYYDYHHEDDMGNTEYHYVSLDRVDHVKMPEEPVGYGGDTLPIVPTTAASVSGSDAGVAVGNVKDFEDNVFHHTSTIRNDELKIDLRIHTLKDLSDKRLREIEKGFNDTVTKFKNNFGLEPNDGETIFDLYLFDDKEQYNYYGKLYNLGISGSGGMTFYGNANVPYKIYVHQYGEILNLKHELTHALESYASGHKLHGSDVNSRIFTEGLADYIQEDNSFIMRGLKDREITSDVLKDSSGNVDHLSGVAVNENQRLSYSIGHAFVSFLQEKYPKLISEYLNALKEDNIIRAKEIISMDKYPDFEPWVKSKDISLYLENMNVLKLGLGEKMFSAESASYFEDQGVNKEYYHENIYDMSGKLVGEMSPVVHYAQKNVIRIWNIASPDMIEVRPEYNFLKLVTTPSGKSAYVYCDKNGHEYFNTKDYIDSAFNILARYDVKLRESSDALDIRGRYSDAAKVFSKLPNADLLLDKFLEKIGYSSYKQIIMSNPEQLNSIKAYVVKEVFENFRESEVKKVLSGESHPEVRNVLMDLTYVDLKSVIGVNGADIDSIISNPDVMLRTAVLGKGNASGISLYVDDQKVGELSTEAGYCVKNLDTGKVYFMFHNVVGMIASGYEDRAYMVVLEKDGKFTTALVNNIQKAADGNVVWDNQFNHPNINNLHSNYKELLLNDASVKDYSHLADVKFNKDDTVIVKGELLDDKGTVSVDDDVHRAVVKHDDQILHQFKSMSFYITEPSADSGDNYGSDFFISDEGKNLRFQLPKAITHLKLVNVNGNNKLVPCTKDGNEHPEGMPSDLTDEYRYIDPIFAHTFEKQSYSKNSISVGLVDFSKYKEGSMFKLQHYSDDYHIHKDEQGNVIRPNNRSYVTKVDLVYDDKVIGMLSDSINQFQGDIFISASLNYSHNDFLSSKYFQKVNIEALENGIYSGRYDVGDGDQIAGLNTDTGYSDKAIFYFKNDSASTDMPASDVTTILPYINEL
ncbi:collagenase [Ehrlichia canis]|uniref:Surface protein-related protein n=1 Tax=Ehrlichia canis (strain Jake) TaxID=269484 RepID=A0ACA6AV96_EHRCJ|nr:collagenase [Ehrlichia canis]AAZ68178.1 surface protein-related protein [Ehrlichia canis str. Jake]AUO54433.1 hypothetical protein C1I72_00715 [Ehrlichia canis]UKC52985.1 hypothetical protein s20019040002_000026 [Ehrlichia canis]UKC53922.1 hypothetical protein s20026770001_000026 [Ehrlichia canis]UKC54858.1 hypothetical protein s21009500007_000026 [Ehrlichia canis]